MSGANGKIGAVMVVGGGIAGMQASLDLAESGFKVYLVEQQSAIGGHMAQLDKTFPTNDCAMCTISPRLVDTASHLNIETLTNTEVVRVDGEAGDFSVTVRRKPRFIDAKKCTGCGDCATACPITLPDEFNQELSSRRAVYKLYPQATPNAFAIEKRGEAPCRNACPIEQRAMGYVALIREGRFADAYRTIREDNPFPSVCGRVCNHRCEEACSRNAAGSTPVNIMQLKRFVADWAVTNVNSQISNFKEVAPDAKKVAIVGSGPAGLTAAQDLRRKGYAVTIFEALSTPGGMMRVGIPAYRLPYDLLQREIEDILSQGAELKLNHRVDDVPALLHDFDAVFVAVGAHTGIKLPIPGNDLPQTLVATDLLRQTALGASDQVKPLITGRRVLVLGGGNVAIDAAMTAVRLGAAWVGMTCLESREKMPAHDWEVRDASEEGIEVYPGRTFKEVTNENGHVTGVRTVNVNFRGFMEGRPDFDEIPNTETVISCDVVIFAIGQKPDLSALNGKVETIRNRTVAVDKDTLATNVPGIFAGGDAVTGTTFVVDAIAAGHKAARGVDAFLTQGLHPHVGQEWQVWPPQIEAIERLPEAKLGPVQLQQLMVVKSQSPRAIPVKRAASERKHDFAQVEAALTEAQAIEEARRCLECGICSECLQCVYACKAGAVNHDQREETAQLQVGAVILAPGFGMYDARLSPEYGLGRFPNVVSSVQFERILSPSGPYRGHVQRPSDGHEPKRIAFIQCVGSRRHDRNWCSAVCCMYATKQALIAKEHSPNLDCTVFFIDFRAFGKGFDAYYDRARKSGVRYVRAMPSAVKEIPGSENLSIQYTPGGDSITEEFDLVVLSTGIEPPPGAQELARRLGVALTPEGFCRTSPFWPLETSRDGIFACGPFTEPKDIPETVMQASGAAAKAMSLLASARGTLITPKVYPPETDTSGQEPRVGVFVCHCGTNIAGVVDVKQVAEYARTLPNVVHAETNLFTCSTDTQERIKTAVRELGLNRVVVASCTPRTHENLFRHTTREASLNPYFFEMANIRDQCSWVHTHQPEAATRKAQDLVRMAIAKVRLLEPLQRSSFPINRSALVIGGGLSGMTAALEIADQGFRVYLVEREKVLGGHMRQIHYLLEDTDPVDFLRGIVKRVQENGRIHVITNAQVIEFEGSLGCFKTTVSVNGNERRQIEHGVVIVATGAEEFKPSGQYLYGQDPRVLTQLELEQRLASPIPNTQYPTSVVMIQCVGSRDAEHPYCSRLCCGQAIKNALRIKQFWPKTQVHILYRDIRTYGFLESYYRQAREAGILFQRFEDDQMPAVTKDGDRLKVTFVDAMLGEEMTLQPDLLALSVAIVPRADAPELAKMLKVPLTQDKFFLEAHMKLRPVDFATEGIFVCGLAHYPKRVLREAVAQACAAAARAATILSKEAVELEPILSHVNEDKCDGCAYCVDPCPFKAIKLIEYQANGQTKKRVQIDSSACKGCGTCQATCPKGAVFVSHFKLDQLRAMVMAALEV